MDQWELNKKKTLASIAIRATILPSFFTTTPWAWKANVQQRQGNKTA